MLPSIRLIVSTLVFVSILLLLITYNSTKSAPYSSIMAEKQGNVDKKRAFGSDPSLLNSDYKTVHEFFKYLHWTNGEACELPMDFGGHIHKSSKFVGMDGQKTLCLDNGVAPDPKSCVVYSFGINNEWSFDDRMADYGCTVFAFDPSMKVPDHDRSTKIKFFRTGLGTENVDKDGRGWKIRTFSTLKRELGSHVIDVLKIDIEGDEWDVLEQLLDDGALENVKQLAVEFHLQLQSHVVQNIKKYRSILNGIELIGFVRFSSKRNPWMKSTISAVGITDFMGYEIAWFNQKYVNESSRAL